MNSTEQKNQTQNCQSPLQLQNQHFRYGEYYLFKKQFQQYLKSALISSKDIVQKFLRKSLDIRYQLGKIEMLVKIFANIIQTEIEQIDYRFNNNSDIIKEISHIYFKQLKTLYLHQCSINNIEALLFLNCQKLQDLCLDRNQISRISCMKKWSHSNLCWFALANNPICQIHSYAKMKFRRVIKYLRLENFSYQNIISEDLSILIMLNHQKIQTIDYEGQNRIEQSKIRSMIKLRHQKLKL